MKNIDNYIRYKYYRTEFEKLKILLKEKETDIAFLKATTISMQEDIDYWEKQFEEMERSKLAWENKCFKLEQQFAVSDRVHEKLVNDLVELEQQLAEIEKERDVNYENYSICWKDNEYLKKQLAEKEKEIAGVKNSCDYYMKRANDLVLKFAEKEKELKKYKSIGATPRQLRRAYQERYKYNERCCELEKQQIQNKINFAVERLEKVKKFVIIQLFITTKGCSDLDKAEAKGCNELREEIIKEIDNQIKQLKGDI